MMANALGELCVNAKEGEEICVNSIGYNRVKVKVNQMGDSIRLKPYVDTQEELQSSQAMNIMAKVLEKLEREMPMHHKSSSHYFSRLTLDCGGNHEIVEIFHTSRSLLTMRGSFFHNARRFAWPKNVEKDSSLFNSNLHQLLECGPASILYTDDSDDGRPIHLRVSGMNSQSPLFYSSLLQTPDYMCYGICLADKDGRKIYRIKLARVQKRSVPHIEGIVNVDARTNHILSFEGVMCNYVIDLKRDQNVQSLPATISFRIIYTHSRGFTEVESVVCDVESKGLTGSFSTFNLGKRKLPVIDKEGINDDIQNAFGTNDYNPALWIKGNVIQYSQEEEKIVIESEAYLK